MRPFYAPLAVLLLAVVGLSVPARAQWTLESPTPTRLDVRGVVAPTAQRVFVATEDDSFDDSGALFESTDGGLTWTQRDVPAGGFSPFNGLFFLDGQRGWAFGNENHRTTDGGTSWQALPFLGSTYRMEFFTPTFGVASTNGGLSVSRDGGLSWTDAPNGLYGFSFADGQTGLGVSASGLFRTTDGGATFTSVRAGSAKAVAFVTPTVAVAVVGGLYVRSTDGGLTWTVTGEAGGRNGLKVVGGAVLAWTDTFFHPNTDGTLARSADGGLTWTDLGTVFPDGVEAFTPVAGSVVVAMDGAGSLFRSADAGATWTPTFASPGPRPSAFSAIAPIFADALTGYVGYGGGFVAKTTDGGQTWAQVSGGYGETLHDVARFADGALVAVGDDRTVLTRDGDGPWTLRPLPNPDLPFAAAPLTAVHVTGAASAIAIDDAGRVYTTTDRGATWSVRGAVAGLPNTADVHLDARGVGYLAGSGFDVSALWRTADGGATWQAVDGPGGAYVAVDAEGQSAWTANVGGLVWRTVNDGATWTSRALPDDEGFLTVADLDFWSESVGYAVGARGYAARSSDGGATWAVLPTPNDTDDFTDLYVVGPNEVWMSTRQGVAYYTATAGQNWAVIPVGGGGFGGYQAIAAMADGHAWTVGEGGEIRYFTGPPPPPDNRPPEAAFTFAANRLTVAFTDQSTDPDGTVVSYFWEFDIIDGGDTSTEPSPTYTFAEAGTYLVRLTVTDDDGATSTTGAAVVVSTGPGGTFGGFTEVTPFAQPFVTPQDEDFWIASAASADVDLDGDLDVVALGFYVVYNQSVEERLTLLRNDGPGTDTEWAFTAVELPVGSLTSGASDLAFGDYDGDGDPDLVVGSDGETVLYRNDAGSLVPTDAALPPYAEDNDQADFDLRSITWADTDNDGDLDLLMPSALDLAQFEYRTALLRNDGPDGAGGWAFTEVDAGFAPTGHAQSAWADDDADGDLDLLLVHLAPLTGDGFIRRYRNDGGNVFVGESLLGGLTVEHGEAQWGDADGDGDLDLLVAANVGEPDGTFGNAMRLYRNSGDGTYAQEDILACDLVCGDTWLDLTAATWADVDSDGDIDILLTGTAFGEENLEGRAAIFLNDGTGDFVVAEGALPAPQAGGTRGGTFSWIDLDTDGDLDYFVAGEYFQPGGDGLIEAQIHAYRNDAVGANTAPAAPSGLAATVAAGGRVALAWTVLADDSTPAEALTYDLDLRLVGAPTAAAVRLPEPGELGATTGWQLASLPDGVYTWSLRAVDSAFNGSAVAEGTFTVGVVAGEGPAGAPAVFALDGVFPNPAVGAATVRYALPSASDVTLTVYDLLGRRVATLVDAAQPAGVHDARWDAAGLAAGSYLVRLTAGTFTATRRVTVAR